MKTVDGASLSVGVLGLLGTSIIAGGLLKPIIKHYGNDVSRIIKNEFSNLVENSPSTIST